MSRENAAWIATLGQNGSERDQALTDLRDSLLRNLRKALSRYPRVDDSFLEDAVQDGILRILEKLSQFEGRSQFLTWATSIAIRVAMTELRRRRWQDVSLDTVLGESEAIPDRAVDPDPGPEEQVERQAVFDKLQEVIQGNLSDRQRTALIAELRGMPQEEIARHLGTNRNAIYKLTHDARKKLRKGLESAGYQAEDISATFAN